MLQLNCESVNRKQNWSCLLQVLGIELSVEELREKGRRRGRPRLRWKDSVKRDVKKAGEEEDGKKKTIDRGGWKRLSDEAVKKLRAAPHL